MKSVEKLVVEHEILIYLFELKERPQPGRQLLNVFKGHPMLVQLLVHAVHIGDDAL